MSSTDLSFLLQRFTMRYRAALLAKAGLLAALALALAAALAWRLFMLPVGALWRVGVPAAVAIVTGASLGWWAYSRWPSRRAGAAYLDRLLGLKQRLVTAEEFAGAPNVPALYPLLVADASKWVADSRTRYPRPFDRATAALLALLLLVLAWPLGGRSPLQQLAQLPRPTPPPVKPPAPAPTPPPPPQNRQPQQQQGGAGQQPSPSSSAGSQGQDQSQGTGRGQASQSPSGQNEQQQTGGGGSSSESGGKQDASGGGARGASQSGTGANERASAGKSGQGQSGPGQGQQQGGAGSAQAQQGQSGGSQSSSGDAQGGTQGAAQQARASGGGKSGDNAQAGAGSGQSVEAKAARAPSGGGSSGSPGSEALQQDIQQLLKEVSGEIHTLQAQIAAAKGQPPPTAGTTTDPELYGASELLGPTGAGNIPIQLKTDATATTSRARAGSGVGRPSGEVATTAPSATPEPAQLSDDPIEEPPGSRDTVPPEYRDVFDRLNRRLPSGETGKKP